MRWLPTFLVIVACGAVTLSAADVRFVRVWPQWRNADAFDRIGEYFGGEEGGGRELVIRTRADDRAGMYFLVRVATPTPVAGQFVLDVILPDGPDPKRFTFPVTIPAKGRVVQLGLSGADWPGGRDVHPVAWKLALVDATGQPVASEQSFLWANPAK